MKRFKKKHTKLPKRDAVVRLLRNIDHSLVNKYVNTLDRTPAIIPAPIREACLAEFDPVRRSNIRYYPDLHNFQMYDVPNRSLPVPKFLAMFHQMLDKDELLKLEHDLTNFRLFFGTTPEDWVNIYADLNVQSCMKGSKTVRCYAHPMNKLAIAALYAPGSNTVVARTIVNTDEKWYVRLFGDVLLVEKLKELGYHKLDRTPREFRMYAETMPDWPDNEDITCPYFDFNCSGHRVLHDTYNPETGLVDIIINPGIQ